MNRLSLAVLVLASALGMAGAAANEDSHEGDRAHAHAPVRYDAGEPGHGRKIARQIDVVAREGDRMSFEPAHIVLKKGETVEFVVRNEGQLEHEFVLGSVTENASHAAMMKAMPDMNHEDPNAIRVAPGRTAHLVWTFSKVGKFEFACLIPGHYEAGMKGEVDVN